jgi:hypothetical protein
MTTADDERSHDNLEQRVNPVTSRARVADPD